MTSNAAVSHDTVVGSSACGPRDCTGTVASGHAAHSVSSRWRHPGVFVVAILALLVVIHDGRDYASTLRLPDYLTSHAALVVVSCISICLALLVIGLAWHAFEQRADIACLSAELERQSVEGVSAALSASGSQSIARLTRAINGMQRRHAERLAELLDVQAAYAHDLRTPLTRLGIRTESIEDVTLYEAMNRDLAEMNELIEASLACVRMQYSAGEQLRGVDADDLVGRLLGTYRDEGRRVELDGLVGHPVMTCPHALRRVLTNLIDNALQNGSDVRVTARIEAQRAMFAVSYSGAGIEPAALERGYAPWYRAPQAAARAIEPGLGLAIVRRLTVAMRGELQLKNRRRGRFEARITLPLVVA